jgi:hypothetical protein
MLYSTRAHNHASQVRPTPSEPIIYMQNYRALGLSLSRVMRCSVA